MNERVVLLIPGLAIKTNISLIICRMHWDRRRVSASWNFGFKAKWQECELKKKKFASYFTTPERTAAEIRPSLHSYIFIFMDAWVIFKPLSLPSPLHLAHSVFLCPLRALLPRPDPSFFQPLFPYTRLSVLPSTFINALINLRCFQLFAAFNFPCSRDRDCRMHQRKECFISALFFFNVLIHFFRRK